MRDLDDLFSALSRSTFRARFALRGRELAYLREKGIDTVMQHAADFIGKRLASAEIPNDGKQTPMRNHPVFIAQHATATCCRGCLEKWHGIARGHALTESEVDHVLRVIRRWLAAQYDTQHANQRQPDQAGNGETRRHPGGEVDS